MNIWTAYERISVIIWKYNTDLWRSMIREYFHSLLLCRLSSPELNLTCG